MVSSWTLLLQPLISSASGWDSIFPTQNTGWLCPDGPCLANSSNHYYVVSSSVPNYVEVAIPQAKVYSYDYTDLAMIGQSSNTSLTDVVYTMDDNLESIGAWALYDCYDPVNSSRCDWAQVYFDNSQMWSNRSNADLLRKVACHETGHSVGLVHGIDSSNSTGGSASNTAPWLGCMMRGWPAEVGLGSTNAAQINDYY